MNNYGNRTNGTGSMLTHNYPNTYPPPPPQPPSFPLSSQPLQPFQEQQHQHPQPQPPPHQHQQQYYYYNGVNPQYPGLRIVHAEPPIFAVDHFLTELECHALIHAAETSPKGFTPAAIVGGGSDHSNGTTNHDPAHVDADDDVVVVVARQLRSSLSCSFARQQLPNLMRKVSALTGTAMDCCELPQVGKYAHSQYYLPHYDAFDVTTEAGRRFAQQGSSSHCHPTHPKNYCTGNTGGGNSGGRGAGTTVVGAGQRIVTVLIYLNTVRQGGSTHFPLLNNLAIRPVMGTAIIFFPSTVDGLLDPRTLHAALPAVDTKYVSQIWIRQRPYHVAHENESCGRNHNYNYHHHHSPLLHQLLGPPLTHEEVAENRRVYDRRGDDDGPIWRIPCGLLSPINDNHNHNISNHNPSLSLQLQLQQQQQQQQQGLVQMQQQLQTMQLIEFRPLVQQQQEQQQQQLQLHIQQLQIHAQPTAPTAALHMMMEQQKAHHQQQQQQPPSPFLFSASSMHRPPPTAQTLDSAAAAAASTANTTTFESSTTNGTMMPMELSH